MNGNQRIFSKGPKAVLPALLLLCMNGSMPASASELTPADAINEAGMQRMITQRALKDYALVGMHNDVGDPAGDLKKMITLFDSILSDLKKFSTSDELKKSLAVIETQWTPIKATLQDVPDRSRAAALQEQMDDLL